MSNLKVHVLGKKYEVVEQKGILDAHSCAGYANLFGDTINVDSGVTPYDRIEIILHEALEIIANKLEIGLDHKTVMQLSNGIAQTLIHSPELVETIREFQYENSNQANQGISEEILQSIIP